MHVHNILQSLCLPVTRLVQLELGCRDGVALHSTGACLITLGLITAADGHGS